MNASPVKILNSPAFTGGAFSFPYILAWVFALVTVLSLSGCTATNEPVDKPKATGEAAKVADASAVGPMISPEELHARLGEDRLVIVHVGHGERGYLRGHLVGAQYLHVEEIYVNREVKIEMPEAEVIEAVVRRLGIDNNSTVVLIGDAPGVFPARFYLTLKHYGLDAELRLLDGHIKGWKAKGLPMTTDVPAAPEPTTWSAVVRPGVLATVEDVERALVDGDQPVVLDVRPTNQFAGETRSPGLRDIGRIEGAVNVPWQSMLNRNPPWLKDENMLRELLDEAGIEPGDPILVYDASGIHAPLAMVVLQQLGHPVLLYDGGFEAWSQR